MRKHIIRVLTFLLICVPLSASAIETREELRAMYRAIYAFEGRSPYDEQPQVTAPYSLGRINAEAQREALEYLNFLRALADLPPVATNDVYSFECQHGAVLMAALDDVEHTLPQPDDMDDSFYTEASAALASSNIARFNWMRPNILKESISYFMRDDGEENLSVLGHRRWLLNPSMEKTGFGLANSATGMTYIALYAHDRSEPDTTRGEVCWPSGGVFPVELMHGHLAWSIMLEPELYDLDGSDVIVELEETVSGARFSFHCSEGFGNGFCTVNRQSYGGGDCLIFRPELEEAGFTDYLQNQVWTVSVTGLRDRNGEERSLSYTVRMASLYEQPEFAVELSVTEMKLSVGETRRLTASVIPSYADDLSVHWVTTDDTVATVDVNGEVRAVAPGVCTITATSANGYKDFCVLTVTGVP